MGRFDINHKNNCPLCGKNMDFIYGDMVCSDCGYRSSYASSTAEEKSSDTAPKEIPTPKISYTPTPSVTNANPPTQAPAKETQKPKSKIGPLILCITILYIMVMICFRFASMRSNPPITDLLSSSETLTFDRPSGEILSELYEEHSFPSIPDVDPDITQYLPKNYDSFDTKDSNSISYPTENSEGIIKALELLFNKEISEITEEELASITSLDFYYQDYNYKKVRCEMNIGDESVVEELSLGDISMYDSDFSIFPNLTSLYMGYGDIASLDGLTHLTNLSTDLTPFEIAELINPAQITSLTLNDLFFSSDFSGIEEFTNLVSLSFDAYHVESFDILPELKNLKALTIEDAQNVTSLRILYNMPQLEYLHLDCEGLRDIGFVSNMPNLSNLTVWYSELKDISVLANCKDTLTTLDLRYNYELHDYDVVSDLTNLESLSLYVVYDFEEPIEIPQLSNMPNLTHLMLGNFDELSGLAGAPELQSLALHDVYVYDMSTLASLQNLTSLELYDMSIEPEALESVMELTSLEYLSVYSSFIWGNAQQLLSLPNLKEFNMEDCDAGFDVDTLIPNNSLEILNMNHAKLYVLEDGKWNYEEDDTYLPLNEHTDIFINYPNLRKLYIAEHEINKVDFAVSLPHLEIFDLTDNYVTDLTPLANLTKLKSIMCYNNPIVNDGGLGNKVSIE